MVRPPVARPALPAETLLGGGNRTEEPVAEVVEEIEKAERVRAREKDSEKERERRRDTERRRSEERQGGKEGRRLALCRKPPAREHSSGKYP